MINEFVNSLSIDQVKKLACLLHDTKDDDGKLRLILTVAVLDVIEDYTKETSNSVPDIEKTLLL